MKADPKVFTNGRLIIDEGMANDLLAMTAAWRSMLLAGRRVASEETDFFDEALSRCQTLRRRLEDLVAEKGWTV